MVESEGAKEGRKELPTNVRKLRPSNANAWLTAATKIDADFTFSSQITRSGTFQRLPQWQEGLSLTVVPVRQEKCLHMRLMLVSIAYYD